MSVTVVRGQDAREGILRGIALAAKAVRAAIGPAGRTVMADRKYGPPILRDGVGIVRAMKSDDPLAEIGLQLVRQVAIGTSDAVGDGSSTAALIFHALACEGLKRIAAGTDVGQLCRAIETGAAHVRAYLEQSRGAATDDTLLRIATAAVHGEAEVGAVVARAVEAAGMDGWISVVEGRSRLTRFIGQDGFAVPIRPLSSGFPTVSSLVEAPLFLVVDGAVESFDSLCPLLEAVLADERPLVVLADDIADDVRAGIAKNRADDVIEIFAMSPGGTPGERADMREDIAVLCGAAPIRKQAGDELAFAGRDVLGSARSAVLQPDRIVITGPEDAGRVERHRAGLLNASVAESDDGAATALRTRAARLSGRAVVIEVGGDTGVELRERRDRVDAAARATGLAARGGVVRGGALVDAAGRLRSAARAAGGGSGGYDVLARALEAPARAILSNCGVDPAPAMERMRGQGVHGALLAADPVEVLVVGLSQAQSVARQFLSIETAIIRDP